MECSARLCLPWKLAQILEGTRAKGGQEQNSLAGALAHMFPADLTPLIDMSGKMWAHTVSVHASDEHAILLIVYTFAGLAAVFVSRLLARHA